MNKPIKRSTVLMPLLLPKISDHAAVQLIDILQQLLAAAEYHYQPQTRRWQRRRRCINTLVPPPAQPRVHDLFEF